MNKKTQQAALSANDTTLTFLHLPRRTKSQETISRVLHVTAEMLKLYGFSALTVTNICKAASISNGTFFHYFKSKNGLLAYFLNEGFNTYLESQHKSFESICSNGKTFCERIINIYIEYAMYCRHIGIDFISKYYSPENSALNRYAHLQQTDDINDIVSWHILNQLYEAKREGLIKETYQEEEIEVDLCTIIKGIIFDWCLSNGSINMEKKIGRLLSIYLSSVVTEKFLQEYPQAGASLTPY